MTDLFMAWKVKWINTVLITINNYASYVANMQFHIELMWSLFYPTLQPEVTDAGFNKVDQYTLTTYDPSHLTTMMVYPTVQFWTFELLQLMI